VERTNRLALPVRLISRLDLAARLGGTEGDDGIQGRIVLLDPRQQCFYQVD
jgi:hypothetical protein